MSRNIMKQKKRKSTTPKPKESALFKDASLATLAKVVAKDDLNGLQFVMLLNIPNTHIVNIVNSISEYGLRDGGENLKVEATKKCLMHWRKLRTETKLKEKEKAKEIDRALKEMNLGEVAEIVMERYTNNSELTPDAFASMA